MLLMIDNYDSFTYNLVQYFSELEVEVAVFRNDRIKIGEIAVMNPRHIVISPGPCTPNEAGISMDVVKEFASSVPILGVCLGHQSIAQAYGARIVHASRVMHGKPSLVHHKGKGLYSGLSNPIEAGRYHSLVVDPTTLPDCFEVDAWTGDSGPAQGEIMGVQHREYPLRGVQFHPESILTCEGKQLLSNFLTL